MTDKQPQQQSEHPPSEHSRPWPIYIMLGMMGFVLLSGYLLSPKTEEDKLRWIELLGTTNQGELLNPPVEVLPGQISDLQSQTWNGMSNQTWKMLILINDQCDQYCQDRLEVLQNIHVRLNRDADELELGLLMAQDRLLPDTLSQYPNISPLIMRPQLAEQLPEYESGDVFMMNPIDVFMMRYDREKTGSQMLADFEHLLDLAH